MHQPVILCGGSGTRLWPLSREHHPKPLHAVNGERTLLQETALRCAGEPLVVCNESHRFLVAGDEVPLTALEFRLVHHFMSRVGRVQPRERLLEEVWGLSSSLETRTIDTHVMRLRDKLGPARNYVETVRGVGYRLVLPESDA